MVLPECLANLNHNVHSSQPQRSTFLGRHLDFTFERPYTLQHDNYRIAIKAVCYCLQCKASLMPTLYTRSMQDKGISQNQNVCQERKPGLPRQKSSETCQDVHGTRLATLDEVLRKVRDVKFGSSQRHVPPSRPVMPATMAAKRTCQCCEKVGEHPCTTQTL